MTSRSNQNFSVGQQLYAVIEFCNDLETLWGKLESGHWDWLGVHPKSKFVLGRPPTQRLEAHASAKAIPSGADGRYRIEIRVPRVPTPSESWFLTPEEARSRYREFSNEKATESTNSGIWKIRLLIDEELEAEETVVQRHANYL
jgi:hypothetical protein